MVPDVCRGFTMCSIDFRWARTDHEGLSGRYGPAVESSGSEAPEDVEGGSAYRPVLEPGLNVRLPPSRGADRLSGRESGRASDRGPLFQSGLPPYRG